MSAKVHLRSTKEIKLSAAFRHGSQDLQELQGKSQRKSQGPRAKSKRKIIRAEPTIHMNGNSVTCTYKIAKNEKKFQNQNQHENVRNLI